MQNTNLINFDNDNYFDEKSILINAMFFSNLYKVEADQIIKFVNMKFKHKTFFCVFDKFTNRRSNEFINRIKIASENSYFIEYDTFSNSLITKHLNLGNFDCCLIYDTNNTIVVFDDLLLFLKFVEFS